MSSREDSLRAVDLTTCDREPIHLCGAIQPFGYLIVAMLPDWNIAHVSANVGEVLGAQPDQLVGRTLHSLFSHRAVHALGNAVNASAGPAMIQRVFGLQLNDGLPKFDVAVHSRGSRVYIELESRTDDKPMQDQLASVQAMIGRVSASQDLDEFYKRLAQQVRLLTFFDRVMVYRFLEDKSGEVIAEARRGDLEPFLGLRYPATDIPAQARRLYRENWVRAIGQIDYVPVPIVPELDVHGDPLDLSQVGLRSVSPIHRQYLGNMGVAASMSISLIVGGELWGLIACHNYDPVWPTIEQRTMAEMFGTFASMQLEARLRSLALDHERSASNTLDGLIGAVSASADLFDGLVRQAPDLCRLMGADSIALYVGGRWHGEGVHLEPDEIELLLRFLNGAGLEVYSTNELRDRLGAIKAVGSQCAGLLAIPISRRPRDYILLFRREVKETIRWGGDPNKAVSAPNQPLTPRNSFATYIQEVEGKSAPWSDPQKVLAQRLRSALLEIVLRYSEATEEQRKRATERQALLIAELNHRVKNLLTLIRSMVGRSRRGSESLEEFIQNLHGRITALSVAHDQMVPGSDKLPELGDLVVAEVSPMRPANFDVHIEGPSVGLNPIAHTALALVLHELTTNAAKYGAFRHPGGALSVTWRVDAIGDTLLDWTESGLSGVVSPSDEGFGSTLIQRTVPFELGGETEVEYQPSGLHVSIRIPATFVTPSTARIDNPVRSAHEPTDNALPVDQLSGDLSVLLVEDNMLIAMETEDTLRSIGVRQVEVCNGVEQALRALRTVEVDLAVLDVNLGHETSVAVADELMRLDKPLIFATAYNDHLMIPEHLRHVPVVRKPTSPRRLVDALREVLSMD